LANETGHGLRISALAQHILGDSCEHSWNCVVGLVSRTARPMPPLLCGFSCGQPLPKIQAPPIYPAVPPTSLFTLRRPYVRARRRSSPRSLQVCLEGTCSPCGSDDECMERDDKSRVGKAHGRAGDGGQGCHAASRPRCFSPAHRRNCTRLRRCLRNCAWPCRSCACAQLPPLLQRMPLAAAAAVARCAG
jgi:hypothetical protein